MTRLRSSGLQFLGKTHQLFLIIYDPKARNVKTNISLAFWGGRFQCQVPASRILKGADCLSKQMHFLEIYQTVYESFVCFLRVGHIWKKKGTVLVGWLAVGLVELALRSLFCEFPSPFPTLLLFYFVVHKSTSSISIQRIKDHRKQYLCLSSPILIFFVPLAQWLPVENLSLIKRLERDDNYLLLKAEGKATPVVAIYQQRLCKLCDFSKNPPSFRIR